MKTKPSPETMAMHCHGEPWHNPFATRFTRPDAMPFLFSDQMDLGGVLESFESNGYVGQIVGPHGCGKTTATYRLEERLCHRFRSIRRVTIRNPRTIDAVQQEFSNTESQLLVVDGVERMSPLHRWLFIQSCRKLGRGVLVTTHRRVRWLPVIFELHPDPQTLLRIVDHLAPGLSLDMNYLAQTLTQADGNIREALMQLYDWFESDRREHARMSDLCRVKSTTNR